MMQDILRLFGSVLRIERHEHGADLRHCKNGKEKLRTVGQHESDTIASFDADPDKTIGDPINFSLEFGIAPSTLLENQGQLVGMLFDSALKHLIQCCGR